MKVNLQIHEFSEIIKQKLEEKIKKLLILFKTVKLNNTILSIVRIPFLWSKEQEMMTLIVILVK